MVSEDCAPNPGGMGTHVYQLARALARSGTEVTLIMGYDKRFIGGRDALDFGGIDIYEYTYNGGISRYLSGTARRRLLSRLNKQAPFDIVHWHCLFGETLTVTTALPRGRPTRVFTNHSSGFLRRVRQPLWRPILRKLLSQADAVIAPSIELETETINLGLARERVFYIPNGVDCEEFSPSSAPPSGRTILCARRLVHKCGVDLLVQAFGQVAQQYPDARLVIAGDGPERPALERQGASLGISGFVNFLGNVDRARMPGVYEGARIAVLPSRVEAVSISALEAMACGLPVVATRVGGLPTVVLDGRTGLTVPPESPEALATAIAYLLAHPSEANRMGAAAMKMVREQFTWDVVARRVADTYRLLSSGGGA